MRKLIIILLPLFSILLYSQTKLDTTWKSRATLPETRLSNVDKQNTEAEISNLKDKLDFQQKLNEQTINSISSQLQAASYSITLFGILFAIAAIGLGIYVTYIERKIVRITEENKELLAKNQKIKQDVEDLNKLIQSDIHNLFLKIKREESVQILDRLVKVPKDISNVCDSLLSRELQNDDFSKLRQAYLNLGETDAYYRDSYKILFFQHFFAQTLKDEQLRQDISSFIPTGIQQAFENDIIKSTSDFSTLLVDKGIAEFKREINLFFNGLTNSQFKEFKAVYQVLFANLKSRRNRFETFNIVESVKDKRAAKISFGNILRNQYSNDNPSESELLVFKELEELIAVQQKEDEEEKKEEETRKKKEEEKKKRQEEQQKKLVEKKKNQENEKKQ